MKQNKKAIYASYGIEFKSGKINAPVFGFINPLLIDGNAKLGKGVYTWSMLAGTTEYNRIIDGMVGHGASLKKRHDNKTVIKQFALSQYIITVEI